jgi:hypothetical protein
MLIAGGLEGFSLVVESVGAVSLQRDLPRLPCTGGTISKGG